MCLKEIGLHTQNLLTILDSIINTIGETYMIAKYEILQFYNSCDIYVSSKNYEESGYSLDLDLLTISSQFRV